MSARITTLKNGLRVVSDTMPGVETASLGVWVDVGTRHEPAEINGVAHLLEHMAFKGTERRSARQIAEEIENVGGHLNAYTSREHTAFYAKVLKQDAALGIDILADILQHSTFEPDELERERTVIIQEIGQAQDTPDDVIFDRFQERAYPGQAMGRPVLGEAEIIRTIGRDAVAGYMNRHYSADRMVLSAAGAVDHGRLVELAERAFVALPPYQGAPAEPARYAGGDLRDEKDLEQVHLVLGFPGVSYTDEDYYAASTLSTVLGGGMSSRLFQEIREKRGLVYTVYSFASSYADGGVFGVYAGTGEDEVEELMPVLCDEIVKAADTMTEAEVARARAQLKASILMGLESTSARCEHVASQLLIYGRPIDTPELVRKIDEVDLAAVGRVARRLFSGAPTFTALGPIGKVESFDRILDRLKA
ncbi:peptidase M16 [Aliidongia dinghuensis]|uniref:Peptidase M16 n=1 Tax=Aliidongia dinghuensis TaxID=1867774 RepID=A0A8J3E381_9PROT|nr:pitrilysin family protein [Aliidongia dinghuensis]GGF16420.1 peptidase M16 [Aliidongia dinghuensis]